MAVNINAGNAEVQQQYEVTTEEQSRMVGTDFGNVSITTSRNDTQMNFMVCRIVYIVPLHVDIGCFVGQY